MALRTAFLNLIKPDYNDAADIADINANMDAIDAKAQELDESGGKALKGHDESDAAHENLFKRFEKIATLGDDIIKKLALTTTITAIKALETNSWFGQLLKMVLTASGVKYNIAQNGYVCLGSFFGGLIIQWGYANMKNDVYRTDTLPISFQETVLLCFATIVGDSHDTSTVTIIWNDKQTTISHVQFRLNGTTTSSPAYFIVGR